MSTTKAPFLPFIHHYADLGETYSLAVQPQQVEGSELVDVNTLELNNIDLEGSAEVTAILAKILACEWPNDRRLPVAMNYSGHQFGQYNPQLGDGRGLLLGEINTERGLIDIHLKGAGVTPFSRGGDGRAVIRSTIREYLASIAMRGLGIPTTGALAMAVNQTSVYRETRERGATLLRTATTHIRFGHFEGLYYRNQPNELKCLADYCISQQFNRADIPPGDYRKWFQVIVAQTATLIAKWQAVGFCHGVMNTDNFSIAGETLDYGPFAFLDDFDPQFICNHSDHTGRYAFDQQPTIARWNLAALAQALSGLIDDHDLIKAVRSFDSQFELAYRNEMTIKLGLGAVSQSLRSSLIEEWLTLLAKLSVDYTLAHRALAGALDSDDQFSAFFHHQELAKNWLGRYREALGDIDPEQHRETINRHNPAYILRNYLAQGAITAAENGDFSFLKALKTCLANPYDSVVGYEGFAGPSPGWAKSICISCSS
ncbi:protein adenylyltransferase SelO family protein [uncultured Umboniibacter sp.]|uniref:protein adenylyltransferase SelO n=1 Tax=uncultured Umboniibacter sp. TaxID=1798917 RepID=UPI0026392B51|nr:YdiU family protein [uncultured Umboniibacter sp.]